MVKGRSILATIGSLALVLVISFPAFATEGETPSTGDEGGDTTVVTEPDTPPAEESVIDEPVTPPVEEPVVEEPVTPPAQEPVVEEPSQPTTTPEPVVEPRVVEQKEETSMPSTSTSLPKTESKKKEASKSNNTRVSGVMFGDIMAETSDKGFVVRGKDIDITNKSAIKVLTDNKDATSSISDPVISGTTATYKIVVTAVDGTKHEYELRVMKTTAAVAATATAGTASTNSSETTKSSGKGLKILISSICVLVLCSGGVFFYLKFLKKDSEDLPDLSHTGGKFKKAFAWNTVKKDDNIVKPDEISDEDFESLRKELNND